MAGQGATVGQAKEEAKHGARRAQEAVQNPWVERIARLGYIVRGLLYAVIGWLAVQVAMGTGGATTDKKGAIAAIGSQPAGTVLLIIVVIGLAGYSLWGFIRAIFDPLNRGKDAKGIAQRIGYVVSGLTYGALVLFTVQILMGANSGAQGGGGNQDLTAKLLSQPWGPWLVGIVGLIGMGGGLGQAYQGITADFKKDFKTDQMDAQELRAAIWVGRFGMIARGVVFALLGFFLVLAALHVDAKEAKGLDGALQTLAQQPYGPWLLGAVALGLVSFGVYSIMCARWVKVIRS